MILMMKGNILKADTDALVNTVNCVGFMGKGIALQFKQAFPDNFKHYQIACKREDVKPGKMLVFELGKWNNPRYIINFPTKRHWRGKSQLGDIRDGLDALIAEVLTRNITSIAIPPLGCGHGGLDWGTVKPMIVGAFDRVPNVKVLLYEPAGSPIASEMPIGTNRPHLTPARALLIKLIEQYSVLEYSCSLLEIQKLAYFMQVMGEDLKLRYEAGRYGPYAGNLNKVIEVLEGHFLRGYGDDQKPGNEVVLLKGAIEEAASFFATSYELNDRLRRLEELIHGFETPYGLELLASVHWVCHNGAPSFKHPAGTPQEALEQVQSWSPRKKSLFKPRHVSIAWERLQMSSLINFGQY